MNHETIDAAAPPDPAIEQILDALLHRVARDGFEAVTIENIVRFTSIPRTTVYRKLGGRDAILAALVGRLARVYEADIKAIASGEGTIWERLEAMIVAVAAGIRKQSWLTTTLRRGAPAADAPVLDTVGRSLVGEAFGDLLHGAHAGGDWPDGLPTDDAIDWLRRQIVMLAIDGPAGEAALVLHVRRFIMPVFLTARPAPAGADLAARLAAIERSMERVARSTGRGAMA